MGPKGDNSYMQSQVGKVPRCPGILLESNPVSYSWFPP
jgi:hypothetical protein